MQAQSDQIEVFLDRHQPSVVNLRGRIEASKVIMLRRSFPEQTQSNHIEPFPTRYRHTAVN